jgi:hypothetical protein
MCSKCSLHVEWEKPWVGKDTYTTLEWKDKLHLPWGAIHLQKAAEPFFRLSLLRDTAFNSNPLLQRPSLAATKPLKL